VAFGRPRAGRAWRNVLVCRNFGAIDRGERVAAQDGSGGWTGLGVTGGWLAAILGLSHLIGRALRRRLHRASFSTSERVEQQALQRACGGCADLLALA